MTKETKEIHERLIELGVDCFCTDYPREVMQTQENLSIKAMTRVMPTDDSTAASEMQSDKTKTINWQQSDTISVASQLPDYDATHSVRCQETEEFGPEASDIGVLLQELNLVKQ